MKKEHGIEHVRVFGVWFPFKERLIIAILQSEYEN